MENAFTNTLYNNSTAILVCGRIYTHYLKLF
jgi:hypothetical protein